jgi:hypothetical protein
MEQRPIRLVQIHDKVGARQVAISADMRRSSITRLAEPTCLVGAGALSTPPFV